MKQLVYAMRDRNTQLVKIGISVDPNIRVLNVARQFCAEVELLGTLEVEDAKKVEQFMHSALSAHRVMGEWFQPDAKTLSYVLAFFVKPPESITPSKDGRVQAIAKTIAKNQATKTNGPGEIRDAIAAAARDQRLTQKQLATMTGLEQANISRYFLSNPQTVPITALRLAEALGLELTVTPSPTPKGGAE